jgi:hypothetical protein
MPPGNPLPVAEGPSKTPAAPARATTPAAPATTLRTDDVPPHAPAGGAGCVAPVRPGIGVRFRRLSPSLVTLRARPPGCPAWARRRPLSAILPLAVLAGPLCALAVPLCALAVPLSALGPAAVHLSRCVFPAPFVGRVAGWRG